METQKKRARSGDKDTCRIGVQQTGFKTADGFQDDQPGFRTQLSDARGSRSNLESGLGLNLLLRFISVILSFLMFHLF